MSTVSAVTIRAAELATADFRQSEALYCDASFKIIPEQWMAAVGKLLTSREWFYAYENVYTEAVNHFFIQKHGFSVIRLMK